MYRKCNTYNILCATTSPSDTVSSIHDCIDHPPRALDVLVTTKKQRRWTE
jgi:hypothetical protein